MSGSKYDAVIYVDGSYDNNSKSYAYGMVIEDKKGVHYFNKSFSEDNKSSMRNVAGEIAGAQAGIQYALDNNYKNIKLAYDYNGIEAWCSGAWKTNKPATKDYKAFYDNAAAQGLKIDFEHVKGHTGDERNEICDSLAKYALGIPDSKANKQPYKTAIALVNESERKGKRERRYEELSEAQKAAVLRSACEKMTHGVTDQKNFSIAEQDLVRKVFDQQKVLRENPDLRDNKDDFKEFFDYKDYRDEIKSQQARKYVLSRCDTAAVNQGVTHDVKEESFSQ